MKFNFFILFLSWYEVSCQMTCGPRASPRMIQDIPCDMSKNSFCQVPGSSYPWSSVRRYIYENQGLMRRMYGDQRQSFILRNEIDDAREKYDTVSYYESSRARPVFGPRSLDVTSEPVVPQPSPPEQDSTVVPSTPEKSSEKSSPETNVTSSERYESSTPAEQVEESTGTNRTLFYSESLNSATNTSTMGTSIPETTASPASSSTSKTSEDLQEEAPNTSVPKKGVNACPVKEEVVAPFWANNTRGETLALLNVYPFEQYVHWEKCSSEFDQMYCRDGCRCEQQYRLHRLLAFDPKNDCRGIFADWFRFPSCCICVCYDLPDNPLLSRVNRRRARL